MSYKVGPIQPIVSTEEVQGMLAIFEEFPEAYSQEYREASLAVARNQAGLRLVKKEIQDIQFLYNNFISDGEIEFALTLHNRLDGLHAVQGVLTEKEKTTNKVLGAVLYKSLTTAKQVLGQRLGRMKTDAEAAAPLDLLNPDVAKWGYEERFAAEKTRQWRFRFDGFCVETAKLLAEYSVTDLIAYVQRGQAIVNLHRTLIDDAKAIAKLVEAANEAYAQRNRITHLVEIAKQHISPWKPYMAYKANECVAISGHVYYTGRDGESGKTEPKAGGEYVHDGGLIRPITWQLLGPVGAFQRMSKN